MVGTYTHGHIDIILCFIYFTLFEGGIFQSCDLLLSLDDGLEDISIIIRVFAL